MVTLTAIAFGAILQAHAPVLCEATVDSQGQITLRALNLTPKPMALLNHPSCIRQAQKLDSQTCRLGLMASEKDAVVLPPGKVVTVMPAFRSVSRAGMAIDYGGIPAEAYAEMLEAVAEGKPVNLPRYLDVKGARLALMPSQTIAVRWTGVKPP